MPKLELGDLDAVARAKEANIPVLAKLVDQGFDLIAPVPSCVLMYKQELPLMFPDDADVQKVKEAFYDPFEYLHLRHKKGEFNTEFSRTLGNISYHVACHLRVQNIGMKTRDILALVPDTTIHPQQRCSGHDGTYAVKEETYDKAVKIARPVVRKVNDFKLGGFIAIGKVNTLKSEHLSSDCPMAAAHIADLADTGEKPEHPMTLLRMAYGI